MPVYPGDPPVAERPAIALRPSQLRRILGIDVPAEESHRILVALGLKPTRESADSDGTRAIGLQQGPWGAYGPLPRLEEPKDKEKPGTPAAPQSPAASSR